MFRRKIRWYDEVEGYIASLDQAVTASLTEAICKLTYKSKNGKATQRSVRREFEA